MGDLFNVSLRTVFILVVLFILTKLMGKKQVSQLNNFDYIIGITIGSIAADISLDIEKNLLSGLISLGIYALFSIIISYITMHSIKLRRYIIGVPTILIENNKIIESGLKRSKIDVNALLAESRGAGYFKLEDIEYAVMETNGKISFMPKDSVSPVLKKDISTKIEKSSLVANVIIDSKVLDKNLSDMNKDKKWLDSNLKVLGYNNYDNIMLATLDINDKLKVYRKDVKSKKSSVLE